ncbi:MAG: hypothetical protein ACLQPD_17870 [Desulfomonilaceae bacterium]
MPKKEFTAAHVHNLFPWISSTTLFNRVAAGLIPAESKATGPGTANTFSLAGLTHIAVVDELCSLGAWKAGVSSTETEFRFYPDELHKLAFNKDPSLSDNEKALLFYKLHAFACYVEIDVIHTRASSRSSKDRRLKRSFRRIRIRFIPSQRPFGPDASRIEAARSGPDGGTDETGLGFIRFFVGRIDVLSIKTYIEYWLGV